MMEFGAEFGESILGAAGALVAVLTLAMGTAIVSTPATAKVAMVGAEQPVKLARVTITATPLPEMPWA
ncbi:hypothetical protein OVA07_03480 [Novosphingobium sp. SL115]|uniref:hypothetical protein n=1 Tax=Novosphingobium sp. SL115 TaxID=2995150 RepID=UPI002274E8AC|nr:hypothetical protein [Novosphingobium sp. SL115]MCY1670068.1 hypothetical protein [Novosphingobium sp. SL115]